MSRRQTKIRPARGSLIRHRIASFLHWGKPALKANSHVIVYGYEYDVRSIVLSS